MMDDEAPPRALYTLISLCGLGFLIQILVAGSVEGVAASRQALQVGANFSGNLEQPWRYLTSVFLHGSVTHLLLNMVALHMVGRRIEPVYGPRLTFLAFCLTGIGGSLASALGHAVGGGVTVSVGASGAICGLIGLAFVFGQRLGTMVGLLIRRQMAIWIVLLLAGGVIYPGIDNFAHIGGLLSGMGLGWWWPLPIGHGPGRRQLRIERMATSAMIVLLLASGLAAVGGYLDGRRIEAAREPALDTVNLERIDRLMDNAQDCWLVVRQTPGREPAWQDLERAYLLLRDRPSLPEANETVDAYMMLLRQVRDSHDPEAVPAEDMEAAYQRFKQWRSQQQQEPAATH